MQLTLMGSKSRMMASGTSHFVRLTSRLKEAKFWMGMTPGMMGCVMPCISHTVHLGGLTEISTTLDPFQEPIDIVEQLGDDEIRSGFTLFPQPVQIHLRTFRVDMRRRVPRNSNTEPIVVFLPYVPNEVIGMLEEIRLRIQRRGVLLCPRRITSQRQNVMYTQILGSLR